MKRKIAFLLAFICFTLPLQVNAYTFQELPVASKSKQWYIEIDKPRSTNSKSLQPKEGIFDMYNLFVKNIGKDVSHVSVEVYHNNPQSEAAYKLFSESNMSISERKNSFTHMKLPLYMDADTFQIVITWEEKTFSYNGHPEHVGRTFQETFSFHEQ